jgi:hypothetical protein
MFYTIITDLVFLCFLVALALLTNKRSGWYVHFTWFLGLSFLVELSGYLTFFVFGHSNHRIFNFFMPVEILFIGWIMLKVFRPLKDARWLIGIMWTVLFTVYLWENIRSGFREYSTVTSIVFSAGMVLACLLYYFHLLRSEEYLNVYRHEDFWIVTGLFLFYFVQTGCNFFFDYLAIINKDTIKPIRYDIFIVLNFILYAAWAYAFLCRYKKTISS